MIKVFSIVNNKNNSSNEIYFQWICGMISFNILKNEDKLNDKSLGVKNIGFLKEMVEDQKNDPSSYKHLIKFIKNFSYGINNQQKDLDNHKYFLKYLFMLCAKKLKSSPKDFSHIPGEKYFYEHGSDLKLNSEISDKDLENIKISINNLIDSGLKPNPKPDSGSDGKKPNPKPDSKPFPWEMVVFVFLILGALLFYYLWKQKQNNIKEKDNTDSISSDTSNNESSDISLENIENLDQENY